MVKEGYTGKLYDMLNEVCWKRPCFTKEYFDYYQLYQLYTKYFSHENIGIFLQEKLVVNEYDFVEDLCRFMNIDVEKHCSKEDKINISGEEKKIRVTRILNHFRISEYNKYPLISLGPRKFKYIVRFISLFMKNNTKEQNMENIDVVDLRNYYRESNETLFKTIVKINEKNILDKYGIT